MANSVDKCEQQGFEVVRTTMTKSCLGCQTRRRLYSAAAAAAETNSDFVLMKRTNHRSVEAVTVVHW